MGPALNSRGSLHAMLLRRGAHAASVASHGLCMGLMLRLAAGARQLLKSSACRSGASRASVVMQQGQQGRVEDNHSYGFKDVRV